MNNELVLNNYLLILKSTTEVYVHGTLESANEEVRNLLKDGLNEILSSQANTYDLMTEYGFYTVSNVDKNEISNTLQKIENKN